MLKRVISCAVRLKSEGYAGPWYADTKQIQRFPWWSKILGHRAPNAKGSGVSLITELRSHVRCSRKGEKKCIHSKIWPDKHYLAALQSQGDKSLRVILWAPTPVMDHSEDFIDRKTEILGSLESCGQDVVSFPQKTFFLPLYSPIVFLSNPPVISM